MNEVLISAVDLGSNSFRLQQGWLADGCLRLLPMMREPVRLAAGLGADRQLDLAARQRGLAALQRFVPHLQGVAANTVRVVATNTLRMAANAADFIAQAEAVLGFPVTVISGQEEARLIYVGVTRAMADPSGRQLVVDIGGGSTEIVVGEGYAPLHLVSLAMGCVSHSARYFPDGRMDDMRFSQAEQAARQAFQALQAAYREIGWQQVLASSGTAKAIANLLAQNDLNDAAEAGAGSGECIITQSGLYRLKVLLLEGKRVENLQLAGLRADRGAVLPGGLAIMRMFFEVFGLECASFSAGGLCRGVLHELLPGPVRSEVSVVPAMADLSGASGGY
ncbi:MAG: Ppx/GppA family phosphatase [Sterolibacterium sp.]|nr:Ppx/GppA family phosphatase [Sterolibacterium sp.]